MGALAQKTVTVCVHPNDIVRDETLDAAEELAGKVFASAGVRINWCHGHTLPGALSVEFCERTPSDFHPGALAFAQPYEGVHITIFYDRVSMNYPAKLGTNVLGHVLAHEITHMLQGVDRHSESGVMKAHWTSRDLIAMESRRLPFTAQDIELIQSGLVARDRHRKASDQVTYALNRPQTTVPGGDNER
ncbi:MAG TPA: hypothetical protein VFW44_11645 [Bryobacteraceae bacterium]|nr:hypothetical protein [Bryobacteraceae bacterium]